MARIVTEEMESESVPWTITLVGGPNDGSVVVGEGYPSVCPPGMWVTEIEQVDALELPTGEVVAAAFREPVQLRYELIEGSEDYTRRWARFRYVETDGG